MSNEVVDAVAVIVRSIEEGRFNAEYLAAMELLSAKHEVTYAKLKHMALGDMIDGLDGLGLPGDTRVVFDFGSEPCGIGSYRGYYDDLAIEWTDGLHFNLADLVRVLSYSVGKTYQGYKGGSYQMDRHTRMWASQYGEASGLAIVGIEQNGGRVVLRTCEML